MTYNASGKPRQATLQPLQMPTALQKAMFFKQGLSYIKTSSRANEAIEWLFQGTEGKSKDGQRKHNLEDIIDYMDFLSLFFGSFALCASI